MESECSWHRIVWDISRVAPAHATFLALVRWSLVKSKDITSILSDPNDLCAMQYLIDGLAFIRVFIITKNNEEVEAKACTRKYFSDALLV
jgi:hypothetical protein